MIVAANHGLIVDQRVHDSFLCRLNSSIEDRIEAIVWNRFD